MTAKYELWVNGLQAGTEAAKNMEIDYAALAKKVCSDAVRDIRKWKMEGKLKNWGVDMS